MAEDGESDLGYGIIPLHNIDGSKGNSSSDSSITLLDSAEVDANSRAEYWRCFGTPLGCMVDIFCSVFRSILAFGNVSELAIDVKFGGTERRKLHPLFCGIFALDEARNKERLFFMKHIVPFSPLGPLLLKRRVGRCKQVAVPQHVGSFIINQ